MVAKITLKNKADATLCNMHADYDLIFGTE